jgi:MerR family mercuric resistance operon transcriptional regulator
MRAHAAVRALHRGELAKRTGVNAETIRYYEKIGLLPEPPRTEGGYRAYEMSHERRLWFIVRSRQLGFTLDEIGALLRLADDLDQPCSAARAVAANHLNDVRAKIADLRRMERVLKDMISQCADARLAECPLIEALFRDGRQTRGELRV